MQNETPFETPVGSPEIVHDSDSEYDSLKRTLEKIRLGKYFQKFKANAIMGEDLKYISEGELANVSSIQDMCWLFSDVDRGDKFDVAGCRREIASGSIQV